MRTRHVQHLERTVAGGRAGRSRSIGAAIRTLDPDILALQEVDHNQPRSHRADLTAVAAEAMGAGDHRFVAALDGTPGARWVAVTDEGAPDHALYGIALLSRYPVRRWEVIRLPSIGPHFPLPLPRSPRRPSGGRAGRRRAAVGRRCPRLLPRRSADRRQHPSVVPAGVERRPAASHRAPAAAQSWCRGDHGRSEPARGRCRPGSPASVRWRQRRRSPRLGRCSSWTTSCCTADLGEVAKRRGRPAAPLRPSRLAGRAGRGVAGDR